MIVSKDKIRAEFDRLKAQCYEFSDPELHIAQQLGMVITHKEAA